MAAALAETPKAKPPEIRCKKCNKLLGYVKGEYNIKCPRCGTINEK
jgi:LSD1 subclass zinc finger protein